MKSQLKQQLRQLSIAREALAGSSRRVDKGSQRKNLCDDKRGTELKCGCAPWNVLPALLPRPSLPT